MKYLKVAMYRRYAYGNIIAPSVPNGFRVRWFREGDEEAWAHIEYQAGEFPSERLAKERFLHDFANSITLVDRCLFIENGAGEAVGTATAMSGTFAGRAMGRLGWVAVTPEYQGLGLGKWLVYLALQRIAADHDEIYLTTQTTSARAVGMYLNYGFLPHPYGPDDDEAWSLLSQALGRDIVMVRH